MRQGYCNLLTGKITIPKSTEVLDPTMDKNKIKAREANGLGYSDLVLSMDTSQPAGLVAFNLTKKANQKNTNRAIFIQVGRA